MTSLSVDYVHPMYWGSLVEKQEVAGTIRTSLEPPFHVFWALIVGIDP